MGKKQKEKKVSRIWIELDKPESKEHADEQCRLANVMLSKLGNMNGNHFFYSEHERRYCFGGNMGSKVLIDNGEWFNLDYLGRVAAGIDPAAPKMMEALEMLEAGGWFTELPQAIGQHCQQALLLARSK